LLKKSPTLEAIAKVKSTYFNDTLLYYKTTLVPTNPTMVSLIPTFCLDKVALASTLKLDLA